MKLLERMAESDYERVVFFNDNASGLRAIIAIHDTTLGPALGGVRMRPFASEDEALDDVLRLARAMTYKAAISGVDLGGGKSVILGDPRVDKTPQLLQAMGRAIDSLGGIYIAGQDIGTSTEDMAILRGVSCHVSCVDGAAGGAGDPSETTALGAVAGIRAVLQVATGSNSLEGRTVAVQGVGHTGYHVARHCSTSGARVIITDIDQALLNRAQSDLDVEVVEPAEIYSVDCDVFSPCSIGAVLNDETIPSLRCRGISGSANNVLAEPRHARTLTERGILYGPDYLVNSGGLIRCQAELLGDVNEAELLRRVERIYDQTLEVFRIAEEESITSAEAADRLAEQRIQRARQHSS